MSRDDLLGINAKIIGTGRRQRQAARAEAFVIVLTNPLDAMVTLMKQRTGFPKHQVVGMAGVLDSSRYRRSSRQELKVSVTNVQAMVLRRARRRHGARPAATQTSAASPCALL
jgi:malate dehydrogenase